MAQQHQVLRLKHRHGFDGLTLSEEAIPQISRHEVLVKVRGVALNYRDIAIATSEYPFPVKDDVVPGSDMAGDVVKVGDGVTDFKVGDRVVAAFDIAQIYGPQQDRSHCQGSQTDGVLRDYVALPAMSLVKIFAESPQSYTEWASIVCTGVTVWNALYGNLPLRPGQTILCQGTGGVSITACILAKAAGATVIITSSSDKKLKIAKEKFGADHGINYRTTKDWASEALKITGDRGVDYIIENGGSGTIAQSTRAIANGGIINMVGFLAKAKQEEMPDVASLVLEKGAVVRGINIGSKQLLDEVVRFVAERQIRLPVEREFAFSRDNVVEAYTYLKSGQHIGKVCITFD